jgi:ABC-type phosphate transport system ATPase subunit
MELIRDLRGKYTILIVTPKHRETADYIEGRYG